MKSNILHIQVTDVNIILYLHPNIEEKKYMGN